MEGKEVAAIRAAPSFLLVSISHDERGFTSAYTPDLMCVFKAMGLSMGWNLWNHNHYFLLWSSLSWVYHHYDSSVTACLRCPSCSQILSVTTHFYPERPGERLLPRGQVKPEEPHQIWLWNLTGPSSFSHFQTRTKKNSWIKFMVCLVKKSGPGWLSLLLEMALGDMWTFSLHVWGTCTIGQSLGFNW